MANLMVYGKHRADKRYGAINLKDGAVGVGLMFASLIAVERLDTLIDQIDQMQRHCPEFAFQIRRAMTSTVIYQTEGEDFK